MQAVAELHAARVAPGDLKHGNAVVKRQPDLTASQLKLTEIGSINVGHKGQMLSLHCL